MADGLLFKRGGSGGTDISDTTATPETVSEGVAFYDATGTKQTGTLNWRKSSATTESIPSITTTASAALV